MEKRRIYILYVFKKIVAETVDGSHVEMVSER